MDASTRRYSQGDLFMAEEEEPMLANPGSPEMTAHVHDYDRFTRMMKYGALVCLVVGLFVLLILK